MDESAEIRPSPELGLIIANLAQLLDEAETMLRDSTSQHAEAQVELLGAHRDRAQERLDAFCVNAGRALTATAQQTDRIVRTHPYQALAVALGGGVLLGLTLARCNS